jgi:hypothetical protein
LRSVRPNCCCRKAINITYYECVFVALGIQHVMRMRYVSIWDLPRSTTLFHIISQQAKFSKKNSTKNKKKISSTNFIWNISHSIKKNERNVIENVYRS